MIALLDSVQINPTWFPYSIDELTGEFIIQDGHVQLLDVRGKHAQMEFVLMRQSF